jgi:diaminopimelate epimerase
LAKELVFWKMYSTGNDFIVIDNRKGDLAGKNLPNLAKQLCERRLSVGADGLVLVCESSRADLKMRVFNPDGTEAEMCGNGIRCLVKFCYDKQIVTKKELQVETLAGVRRTWLSTSNGEVNSVKVDMGEPNFDRRSLPMLGDGSSINEKLRIDGEDYSVTCLSLGDPHCVLFVDNVATFRVSALGPKLENHEVFQKRVNVEFVEVVNENEVKTRVWERGVGETLASGTGACASVVAGHLIGRTGREVTVHLLGGDLKITYNYNVLMQGPAVKVFEGKLT